MRLLVIGDGLLANEIEDAFCCLPPETRGHLRLLGHDDIEVTDAASVARVVGEVKPDVIVNTAAMHRLGECEENPARAQDVNARGAENVAKAAPTIYVSTDYVFTAGGPHEEVFPGAMPRSVYGRTKLAGEFATVENGGIVVRVAGLFGHYRSHKGPSFPEMLLSSHDPIRLPTDQVFSPTYAPDAAERILTLAYRLADGKAEGIYHATNKGAVSWAEFAEAILAYTGHERHVLPYKAADLLRPSDSSLVSRRLPQLPHWQQGIGRWAQREGHYRVVSPLRDH